MTTTQTTIFESRLTAIPGSVPTAWQVGPEWTDTECEDVRDWLDAAADGIGEAPERVEGLGEVHGLDGATIYGWTDSDGERCYTAIQERGGPAEAEFFIATDSSRMAIYGVGETEEAAEADARRELPRDSEAEFELLPSTRGLYERVLRDGGAPDVRWTVRNGIAVERQ